MEEVIITSCSGCNCDIPSNLLDEDNLCRACLVELEDPEFTEYIRSGAK